MKKKLLFIFLVFVTYSYAQKISVIKGEEFVSENGILKKIIGEDRYAFYVYREEEKSMKTNYYLEKYNKESFKREWAATLEPAVSAVLDNIVLEKNKVSFYYIGYDRGTSSFLLSKFSLDAKTGETLPLETLYTEKAPNYTLSVSLSSDTTMLLLKYLAGTYNPLDPFGGYQQVKVFDIKKNKEIFTKELPSRTSDNEKIICNWVSVDNSGNLLCGYDHIFEKTKTSPKRTVEGIGKTPVTSTVLNGFDLNFDVNDQSYLGSASTVKQEHYDYTIYTGIFIDKKNKTAGNYFMKIDLNKSKEANKTITYFDEQTAKLYEELDALPWNSKEKLISYKTILDKTTEDVYSICFGATQGIFVTKFTKDGQVSWTKVIPRSADKLRPGFAFGFKKGQLYFVCLDNPKNQEGVDFNNFSFKKIKGYSASTGQNVVCFSVSDRGTLTKFVLSTNDFSTANFVVPLILDYSEFSYYDININLNDTPILKYTNGKREQFVRFKFE